ncbi:hypothetical protein QCD79_28110, partial [Pseudomonas quasicaspiana]|nr:hypothetical protein [Pseudomonas quasicaspiana]
KSPTHSRSSHRRSRLAWVGLLVRRLFFDNGLSSVLYSDQAQTYINGEYVPQHLSEEDVAKSAQGTLKLVPGN